MLEHGRPATMRDEQPMEQAAPATRNKKGPPVTHAGHKGSPFRQEDQLPEVKQPALHILTHFGPKFRCSAMSCQSRPGMRHLFRGESLAVEKAYLNLDN